MQYSAATTMGHQSSSTTTTTTTVLPTTTRRQIQNYIDITNKQHVDGHWSKDSIKTFLTNEQIAKLARLPEDDNAKYTVAAIILLNDNFAGKSVDWAQSKVGSAGA